MGDLLPRDIALPQIGILTATLGRAEPEALACVIVRWHHVHSPDLWVAVGLAELGQFMLADAIVRDWDNPVWTRTVMYGFQALVEGGFVAGWVNGDPESRGLVTDKFLAAIAGSYWDRRPAVEAPRVLYRSAEIEAEWSAGRWLLRRGDREIGFPSRTDQPPEAWAIMFELDEAQRIALDLPECEAVTGGTALCLGRADKVADGTVPLPSAPTCWDELASAELWPLGWLGAHRGHRLTVALPEEQ